MLYYVHKILVTETKNANVIQRHVLHFPHHLRPNPHQKKEEEIRSSDMSQKMQHILSLGTETERDCSGRMDFKTVGFFLQLHCPNKISPMENLGCLP